MIKLFEDFFDDNSLNNELETCIEDSLDNEPEFSKAECNYCMKLSYSSIKGNPTEFFNSLNNFCDCFKCIFYKEDLERKSFFVFFLLQDNLKPNNLLRFSKILANYLLADPSLNYSKIVDFDTMKTVELIMNLHKKQKQTTLYSIIARIFYYFGYIEKFPQTIRNVDKVVNDLVKLYKKDINVNSMERSVAIMNGNSDYTHWYFIPFYKSEYINSDSTLPASEYISQEDGVDYDFLHHQMFDSIVSEVKDISCFIQPKAIEKNANSDRYRVNWYWYKKIFLLPYKIKQKKTVYAEIAGFVVREFLEKLT